MRSRKVYNYLNFVHNQFSLTNFPRLFKEKDQRFESLIKVKSIQVTLIDFITHRHQQRCDWTKLTAQFESHRIAAP